MRIKAIVVTLSLSLVCLFSRASFADTIEYNGPGGGHAGGEWVYPYTFTVTGPGGTSTNVDMSCLNLDRDVTIGVPWTVDVISVANVTPSEIVDGNTGLDLMADAYLFNQYASALAAGNQQQVDDIQFAIWSIMDPTDVQGNPAFDANAQALAAEALLIAPTEPSSYYGNDTVYIANGSYAAGDEPQMFMTDPEPPASTPEPTSLILFGTGMLGSVGLFRYRRRQRTH
jgi:hypothetical protein